MAHLKFQAVLIKNLIFLIGNIILSRSVWRISQLVVIKQILEELNRLWSSVPDLGGSLNTPEIELLFYRLNRKNCLQSLVRSYSIQPKKLSKILTQNNHLALTWEKESYSDLYVHWKIYMYANRFICIWKQLQIWVREI